jgi:hypothetical protein
LNNQYLKTERNKVLYCSQGENRSSVNWPTAHTRAQRAPRPRPRPWPGSRSTSLGLKTSTGKHGSWPETNPGEKNGLRPTRALGTVQGLAQKKLFSHVGWLHDPFITSHSFRAVVMRDSRSNKNPSVGSHHGTLTTLHPLPFLSLVVPTAPSARPYESTGGRMSEHEVMASSRSQRRREPHRWRVHPPVSGHAATVVERLHGGADRHVHTKTRDHLLPSRCIHDRWWSCPMTRVTDGHSMLLPTWQ